jgi:NAD+ diphosphatase
MPDPLPAGLASGAPVYLGSCKDLVYYAAGIPDGAMVPYGWEPFPVRELSGRVSDREAAVASYAVRVFDYDRSTTYCGRCGARTRPLVTERAKVCPACSSITYPRISPAVIVLVKKGDEGLLARSPGAPPGFFSLIAGFNEPGENLEETVRREVREEVGIEVRNLRYFGSEPWPFPDSLMTGFVADHAGGEIRTDGQEIEAAGWFTRDSLPLVPMKASISRALITAWVRGDI